MLSYLPYQAHYSRAQLEEAYPNIDAFFTSSLVRPPSSDATRTPPYD